MHVSTSDKPDTITVGEAFPSIAARLSPFVRDALLSQLSVASVFAPLLEVAVQAHVDSNQIGAPMQLATLEQFIREIVDAKALLPSGHGLATIALLQLAVATSGIGQCMATAQVARAGDWVQASLSDDLAFGAEGVEVALETDRVKLLVEMPPVIPQYVPSLVCEWADAAFQYFRKMNAMTNIGMAVHGPCLVAARQAKDLGNPDLAAEALLSIGWWAGKVDDHIAFLVTRTLEQWRNDGVARDAIARGFMTTLGRFTTLGNEVAWAHVVEREQGASLDAMQRLAVLSSASSDTAEYSKRKPAILMAISAVHKSLSVASVYQRALWLSSGFEQIAPLVYRLANAAHGDELVELLSAWQGVPLLERVERLLVLVPFTDRGAMAIWGNDAVIDTTVTPLVFRRAVEDMNTALNVAFSVEGEPDLLIEPPSIPERMGTATDGSGDALFSATSNAYGLISLGEAAVPAHCSFTNLNGMPLNVQSAALRVMGYTWPNAISLRKPLPDAAIERVGIWHRPLWNSEHEVSAVTDLFTKAGVDVVIEQSGMPDEHERFVALYQRRDIDVIWVIGHGAYVPYSTHLSSIDIFESGGITVEQLSDLVIPPRDARRLLVLNVCNAGNVTGLTGVSQAGIAGLLTTSSQATTAHLWTADPLGAPTLGILLAGNLAARLPYFEGFVKAMKSLAGSDRSIADELTALGAPQELVDQVLNVQSPLADFTRSGSAVFYE